MTDPTIDGVFDLLDKWRHLPAYQLERRADIYFAMFLPDVLNAHYKPLAFRETIIPEFPLKKANNQSDNADFFALSEDGKCALLIELKTDMGSLRKKQDGYLRSTAGSELRTLVDDILRISRSKYAEHRKYIHLLELLSKLGLVDGTEDVWEIASHETSVVASIASARPMDWPRKGRATMITPVSGAITRCWPSPPEPETC